MSAGTACKPVRRGVCAAALLLIGALALDACGALDPYPTVPRDLPLGTTSYPRVAICYNSLSTELPAVQQQAQQECDANAPRTVAEPSEIDWYLQNCPLLLPTRATYICRPAAKR
jgi:hypothetical protein